MPEKTLVARGLSTHVSGGVFGDRFRCVARVGSPVHPLQAVRPGLRARLAAGRVRLPGAASGADRHTQCTHGIGCPQS